MEPRHHSRADTPAVGPRFVALDGLRAVGALAILVTHVGFQSGHAVQGQFAGFLARLDSGVALFFVVSGFLLFRPHVVAHLDGRSRPAPGRYLRNRAVRILPVLWVAVIAAWLLLGDGTTGLYLAHAFLVQIYIPDHFVYGLTQMWSLATEVAFYLVLPAAASALCRGGREAQWVRRTAVALGATIVLGPLWMATSTALGYSLPRLWLPGFIGGFGAGMLLALLSVASDRGILPNRLLQAAGRFPGTSWGLAAALYALGTTPLLGPLDLSEPTPASAALKNILYCLIAVLIVTPCVPRQVDPPALLRSLSGSLGRRLGDTSYGIFAYHVVVLGVVDDSLGLQPFDGRFLTRLLPTLIVTLVLASLSYHLMERPLMRRARRVSPTSDRAGSADEQLSYPPVPQR